MSTRIGARGRWLLLTVAIVIAPASAGAAGISPVEGRPQTADGQAVQDQSTRAPSPQEGTTDNAGTIAAQAAASVAPTIVSPPSWLPSSRNIDFRLRPNAGLRLPPLFPGSTTIALDDSGTPTPWSIRGSLATLGVNRDRQSAKFQEFRDVRDGTAAGIEAHFRDGNRHMNVVGRHLGLRDQDLEIDAGQVGKYQLAFGFGQIPHNYSFDSRSLYDGIGTGQLTISDRIQTDLQNSTTTQEVADKIRSYQVESAQTVEVSLLRKKVGVDFALFSAYPFTVRAAATDETKDGVRPLMGSFGFGDFEELPWPVAFEAKDVRVTFEYAKPESRLYATGTYRVSLFDNHIPSLRWDNPYRITDSIPEALFANGPVAGQMAMPPSNQYQEATLSSVFSRLPRQTSLSGLVSVGFLRQNEPLVPFSTNTAAIMPSGLNATNPAALPRSTAEAAMNTSLVQARLTTQPTERLRFVAQYRFLELANQETPFTIAAFIRTDAAVRRPTTPGATFSTVSMAYNRHTASAEGSLNLAANTRLGLTYTFERMNRDFREVAWMNDNRVKVSLDTRPASRLELKTSYERSSRDIADYRFNQYNIIQGNPLESPMLPFLRKFDEAARKRDEAQAIATLYVTDALSLSAMALYGHDDFFRSPFGVLDDNHRVYSLDASYSATERVSLYASYNFERYSSSQKSRQWGGTTVSNPYTSETGFDSNSNWEARRFDDIDTASVGLEAYLIPQRLRFNVAYTYSKTDGSIGFASPLGTAANDVNAFEPASFPAVDDVAFHTVNPELEYRASQRLALSAGYVLEKFAIDDVNYRGFTYTPRNLTAGVNAGLLMGSYLFPPYNVNALYVRAKVGF